jgi:hypothetical protein
MTTATQDLTRRTPEAETFYNIKQDDYANFHEGRPVVMGRTNTGNYGTSLEYSFYGGRNWGIMSFHTTVAEALDAFSNLALGKDRDPLHYRVLKESV